MPSGMKIESITFHLLGEERTELVIIKQLIVEEKIALK